MLARSGLPDAARWRDVSHGGLRVLPGEATAGAVWPGSKAPAVAVYLFAFLILCHRVCTELAARLKRYSRFMEMLA